MEHTQCRSSIRPYGKCRRGGNPLKNAVSHCDLEKPGGFPTFPTGATAAVFIDNEYLG